MKLFDLTGRVAIVTGGNGGIGLGMAKGLAQAGATIVLAGRNKEKAKTALAALGGKGVFLSGDVTKAADCRKLIADTVAQHGRLDILINNAGTSIRKMPELLSESDYTEAMRVLGACFARGRGVPQDKVEACKWWKLAADRGDDSARAYLDHLEEQITASDRSDAKIRASKFVPQIPLAEPLTQIRVRLNGISGTASRRVALINTSHS